MAIFACLFALKFLIAFPLITIPLDTSLSFSFDQFSSNSDQNITYEGDYGAVDDTIKLSRNQTDGNLSSSRGRATYNKALHLWDKALGNITDFSTHFSFSIISLNQPFCGDVIAFFLAPAGSTLPDNPSGDCGNLGLTSDTQTLNTSGNHFVAVEFDTFQNDQYDPPSAHVGIDINSMQSVVNVSWDSSFPKVWKTAASISYSSTSKNLSVVFTGCEINDVTCDAFANPQRLSYNLDLREYLPEWVTFGFTGATGEFALQRIYSWDFTSSLEDYDNITDPGVPLPNPKLEHAPTKNWLGIPEVVLISVGCIVVVAVCVGDLILFAFRRKRMYRNKEAKEDIVASPMTLEFQRSLGPNQFLYSELARCTNYFAQEEMLGEGGFGGVYKGYLKEFSSYVAVKKISRGSKQGIKEYASEVTIIGRLRHRHLVQLIGWCHEEGELLLVYEFMANGSLDYHLFKRKSHLTWPIRYRIAQGLASGLLYLHEGWEQCVVHRDIKCSNIMLDTNFNAKLGDFGLARLVDHDKESQTTMLAGTMGYMAPECHVTGKASKETDVYSFGVVALEIACGRKPIDHTAEVHQVNIVNWVWGLYGMGNLYEAVDPKFSLDFNEQEMEHLVIVGLWCAHPESNCRPSIRQAIHVLNFEAPLPALPPNKPVPTYCVPSQYLPTASLSSQYDTCGSKITLTRSSMNRDNTDSSYGTSSSAQSPSSADLLSAR